MSVFVGGPIWPDTAGTATDPTTAFVVSDRILTIKREIDLAVRAVVTVAACRAIEILCEISTDGTNYRIHQRKVILGATVGTHQARFTLPPFCYARFSARRYGGGATSRLVMSADARTELGNQSVHGQPIELYGHQEDGVECWGDGAGAAVVIPAGGHVAAPAGAADQQWIPTGEATVMVVDFTASVVAPTSIEFEVRETTDDAVSVAEVPAVNTVTAGVVQQQIAQEQLLFGANVTRRSREISVRPNTAVLVLAQRTGGGGTTEAIGIARLWKIPAR